MRFASRFLTAIAASILVLYGASQAVASPAVHSTFSVVGDVFVCDGDTYTITSGHVKSVLHLDETASGNFNITGTDTPVGVMATDGTNTYRIVGAVWFGATFNAQQGIGQETFTGKLQIIGPGGQADSVNLTFHLSPNGKLTEFDFGSCAF